MKMTPETWESVKALYQAALQALAGQRIRCSTEARPEVYLKTKVIHLLANLDEAPLL